VVTRRLFCEHHQNHNHTNNSKNISWKINDYSIMNSFAEFYSNFQQRIVFASRQLTNPLTNIFINSSRVNIPLFPNQNIHNHLLFRNRLNAQSTSWNTTHLNSCGRSIERLHSEAKHEIAVFTFCYNDSTSHHHNNNLVSLFAYFQSKVAVRKKHIVPIISHI